jgi:hypothetical protein
LRVRDISRSAKGLGVWLPVLPETAMSTGPVKLGNIVAGPGYRNLLRVYALDEPLDATVFIQFFRVGNVAGTNPDQFLLERRIQLQTGIPFQPQYAQLDLASVPEIASEELVRLTVTTNDYPGARLWAMVSTTNNDTQEVTATLPNPAP